MLLYGMNYNYKINPSVANVTLFLVCVENGWVFCVKIRIIGMFTNDIQIKHYEI